MKKLKSNFLFFSFLTVFFSKEGITDYLNKPSVEVNTSLHKKWTLDNNDVITAVHPPLQSIKLQTHKGEIIADPFKKGKDTKDPINGEDIQIILQQNNYSKNGIRIFDSPFKC